MTSGNPLKFHVISGLDQFGSRFIEEVQRPSYEVGDAKYFPDGLGSDWQLRPLTGSDMIVGISYSPGTSLLARRLPGIGGLYYCVHLPFARRRNTRANVAYALEVAMARRPDVLAFTKEMELLAEQIAREQAASGSANQEAATL